MSPPLRAPETELRAQPRELQFLRNIGLLLTYKCQIACPHCIIEAGPKRTETMAAEDALRWITEAASYRQGHIKLLSLTGGEPFIDIPKLNLISSAADTAGLLTSAVTNAYWATTYGEAVRVLQQVPAIRLLAVSTDVYHQSAIPFGRVKNAILAARHLNIPCSVAVCTADENDPGYQRIMAQLVEVIDRDSINTAVTMPIGRAEMIVRRHSYPLTAEPSESACSDSATPIVFPDGRVVACIGPIIALRSNHPLVLGHLGRESLASVLDRAETNMILHAIRALGPVALVKIMRQSGIGDVLPPTFMSDTACDACYSIMAEPRAVEFLHQLEEDARFRTQVIRARERLLGDMVR